MQEYLWEVIVVGAGLCGLSSAYRIQKLSSSSQRILVIDKGRGVGGRLANRRVAGAVLDHGVQLLPKTGWDDRLTELRSLWQEAKTIQPWFDQFDRGVPTMSMLAKCLQDAMAQQSSAVTILNQQRLVKLVSEQNQWQLHVMNLRNNETTIYRCQKLILTIPIPQILLIFQDSEISFEAIDMARLASCHYEKCLVAMATIQDASSLNRVIPAHGLLSLDNSSGPIKRLIHQKMKGVSEIEAITIQAGSDYSEAMWEVDREHMTHDLLSKLKAELSVNFKVDAISHHGWKFAQPINTIDQHFAQLCVAPVLYVAGDAFGDINSPAIIRTLLSGYEVGSHLMT